MPLNIPQDPTEIETNIKTDVSNELPNSKPFLKNSWWSALIVGLSFRIFDVYENVREAVREAFYDTSSIDQLRRQAGWYGITQIQEQNGSGSIVVGGTLATAVPIGTQWVTSDDITVETTASVSITNKSSAPASITSSGTKATVTMPSNHELSNGIQVTISGAVETEYNGTFDITVISETVFEYELPSATTSPATGVTNVSYDSALIPADSVDFGADTNLEASTALEISGTIAGIDSTAYVSAASFGGGRDLEDTEDFRERFLRRVRNPIANFNTAAIDAKVREYDGVTRVYIENATPSPGQVRIAALFDNRDGTPNAQPADIFAIQLLVDEIKPANTSSGDIFVISYNNVTVNFDFASITPDTPEIRTAVENNLKQFFATQTEPSTDVQEDAYKTAIYNTVDPVTGARVTAFTLNSPSGDIVVPTDNLAALGTVVFS
jgi:uncharacterized phage protein gp47/JayE